MNLYLKHFNGCTTPPNCCISSAIALSTGAIKKCRVRLFSLQVIPVIPTRFLITFILLFSGMVPSNCCCRYFRLLYAKISIDEGLPYFRLRRFKRTHISNINCLHSPIFYPVHATKILYQCLSSREMLQPVSRPGCLNERKRAYLSYVLNPSRLKELFKNEMKFCI